MLVIGLCGLSLATGLCGVRADSARGTAKARIDLGKSLFADAALSSDGRVSCRSCHDPAKAYADGRPASIGVHGLHGTRNAPSLLDAAGEDTFFWDGRRARLEDAVTDAFTNPVELGLASTDELLERLRGDPPAMERFRSAFPDAPRTPTLDQVRSALAAFVRSLAKTAEPPAALLAPDAALGKSLFEGPAGCTECHASTRAPERFSDGLYHHSSVTPASLNDDLPALARAVVAQSPAPDAIGAKVLADPRWSALGRFVVTRRPADIAAYRTPSLRNVACTAPYMHDGSIATLPQAVEHELFYRSFSRGHPVNLSAAEREALVAYLGTLVDSPGCGRGPE